MNTTNTLKIVTKNFATIHRSVGGTRTGIGTTRIQKQRGTHAAEVKGVAKSLLRFGMRKCSRDEETYVLTFAGKHSRGVTDLRKIMSYREFAVISNYGRRKCSQVHTFAKLTGVDYAD